MINIAHRLNDKFNIQLDHGFSLPCFKYITDGVNEEFKFMGVQLWHSENDERICLDAEHNIREDLEHYLEKEALKIINNLKDNELFNREN